MRRSLRLLSFVALAAVGLLAAASPLVGGRPREGTAAASMPNGGVLRLHLGGDARYLGFSPAGSTVVTRQTLTFSGSCGLTSTTSYASLLGIPPTDGSPTKVGTFENGIGVCGSGSEGNGQPAGRVDANKNQVLVLKLGSGLAGKRISAAELDIEAKFRGVVDAELRLGGKVVGGTSLNTSTAPDSSPDSGDNDNVRWVIGRADPNPGDTLPIAYSGPTPIFDEIRLKAASGAFSLDSGADGTLAAELGQALGTKDSLFQLTEYDGVLDCETHPNGLPNTSGDVGGNGTPVANVTRLFNAGCTPIPYALRTATTATSQTVTLLKDLGTQTAATFRLHIAWEPEPVQSPIPATLIDPDPNDAISGTPIQWCLGTAAAPVMPTGQIWCLTGQTSTLVGGGDMQVTEDLFGAGDPNYVRPK